MWLHCASNRSPENCKAVAPGQLATEKCVPAKSAPQNGTNRSNFTETNFGKIKNAVTRYISETLSYQGLSVALPLTPHALIDPRLPRSPRLDAKGERRTLPAE